MNFPDLYDGLRKDVKNFGVSRALYGLTFRAVNRAVDLKVLTCVVVREPDPEFAKHDPRFACSFLSADRLRALSSDPTNQLEPAFLEDALAKGDECFGILDGETLASYGWYSNRPTDIDGEVRLSFSARYVYMYKGFTRPSHRGQRLHAIGMTLALAAEDGSVGRCFRHFGQAQYVPNGVGVQILQHGLEHRPLQAAGGDKIEIIGISRAIADEPQHAHRDHPAGSLRLTAERRQADQSAPLVPGRQDPELFVRSQGLPPGVHPLPGQKNGVTAAAGQQAVPLFLQPAEGGFVADFDNTHNLTELRFAGHNRRAPPSRGWAARCDCAMDDIRRAGSPEVERRQGRVCSYFNLNRGCSRGTVARPTPKMATVLQSCLRQGRK